MAKINNTGILVIILSSITYVLFNDIIRESLAGIDTQTRMVMLLVMAVLLFAFTRNSDSGGGKR